jgi:hypothetical protein
MIELVNKIKQTLKQQSNNNNKNVNNNSA